MMLVLDTHQLLLLGLLTASSHWLIARAEITRFAWSRATGWLDKLLRCPACSGYWLGLAWTAAGVQPVHGATPWGVVALGGVLGVVVTPVVEAVLLWGLEHSAVPEPEPAPGLDQCAMCDVNGVTWAADVRHTHCRHCAEPYELDTQAAHVCQSMP